MDRSTVDLMNGSLDLIVLSALVPQRQFQTRQFQPAHYGSSLLQKRREAMAGGVPLPASMHHRLLHRLESEN
jgi:hypothetical protein